MSSDSEASVKSGSQLLDRLIKDIVLERSEYYKPGSDPGIKLELPNTLPVPGSVPLTPGSLPNYFNLSRFIPLLAERITTVIFHLNSTLVGSFDTLVSSTMAISLGLRPK